MAQLDRQEPDREATVSNLIQRKLVGYAETTALFAKPVRLPNANGKESERDPLPGHRHHAINEPALDKLRDSRDRLG